MNRTDLHLLADARVADAEALLRSSRWAAAYYLLGYAVECGITHRLDKLLRISGAQASLDSRTSTDIAFEVNWNTVRDWNESARYDHSITEGDARDMLVAVSDPISGVLPWLKSQW